LRVGPGHWPPIECPGWDERFELRRREGERGRHITPQLSLRGDILSGGRHIAIEIQRPRTIVFA
jgi:hypothetical protein